MRLIKPLLIAVGLMALSSVAVLAAVVTDRSAFSGDETVITFDDLGYDEAVTTQYTGLGVTVSGGTTASDVYDGAFPWPGSGGKTLGSFAFAACPCGPVTFTFDGEVTIAGAEFVTDDGATLILEAYSGGTLVDSASFATGLTPSFAGLEVSDGFDTLVVSSDGPFGDDVFLVDDFTFESAANTKASILIGSGVPGKGLGDAPGLQKEFNPKSKAGENAGKK